MRLRRATRCGTLCGTAGVSLAVLMCTGGPAAAASHSGWGPAATYLGRYQVHPTPSASTGSSALSSEASAAGIFGLAVAGAEQVIAAQTHPAGGELTMFMRIVKKGEPPVPSGVLDLHSAADDRVFYLTELTSNGASRSAKINGGAFVGPVIGSFTGTSTKPDRLSGTVTAEGLGRLQVTFTRFSEQVQP